MAGRTDTLKPQRNNKLLRISVESELSKLSGKNVNDLVQKDLVKLIIIIAQILELVDQDGKIKPAI